MKSNKKIKGKFDYDFENDSFFIYIENDKEEYKTSHNIDNFIIDINKKGQFKSLEILNASKIFKTDKFFISQIYDGDFTITIDEKRIEIQIQVKSKIRNKINLNTLNIEKINSELISPINSNLAIA